MYILNQVANAPLYSTRNDNIERWFEGIYIPARSSQAVSSTEIACGVDKPDSSHTVATLKQEVNAK
ncbi:MAG: hypothetical protein ACFB02_13820, partial [Mastigocoleus sp.]